MPARRVRAGGPVGGGFPCCRSLGFRRAIAALQPLAACHCPPSAMSRDFSGCAQALSEDGYAVVPVLSSADCAALQHAYTRSLATPGMPDQRGGGMVNIFFLPEKEVMISGNRNVYEALAAAYGERRLSIQMHERMNAKMPGNGAQALHMDVDLFHPNAAFGVRVQALVCFDIDEQAEPEQSGSIALCRRFHHWLAVAQAIFHPHTGVDGMRLDEQFLPVLDTDETYMSAPVNLKENAGRKGRYAHRFMAVPREDLKLGAMSAYIRLAEKFAEHGATAFEAPQDGQVEGVLLSAMVAHILKLESEGTAVPLPADGRRIGGEDRGLRAVKLRAGEMVMWDSTVPHHNVAASATNKKARLSAYIDIAPASSGNYAPPEEQIADQAQRLLSSTIGSPESPNNGDELAHLIPSWQALPLDYRLKFTTDGQYAHIKAAPLLKALYGFNPISGERYSWDDYHQEEGGQTAKL